MGVGGEKQVNITSHWEGVSYTPRHVNLWGNRLKGAIKRVMVGDCSCVSTEWKVVPMVRVVCKLILIVICFTKL